MCVEVPNYPAEVLKDERENMRFEMHLTGLLALSLMMGKPLDAHKTAEVTTSF
jgi:hypothetical protein